MLSDLRGLIQQAREGVARAVDSSLTTLYWHVGQRIRRDILNEDRADYGRHIVAALGRQLETEFGRGFGEKNLRRMIQFAEVFPDREIVVSLIRQLTWTHIALLELQKSGIHVASYWTDALPKKELERKLHEAVRLARARVDAAKD
jgi:hypothetical protein